MRWLTRPRRSHERGTLPHKNNFESPIFHLISNIRTFAPNLSNPTTVIAYIKGVLQTTTPAYVVLENNGIGYHINISLYTYSKIQGSKDCQLYIHHYIKDESLPMMYGFAEESEKLLFLDLISVSGIGPNTALMMLSSYNPAEIQKAVVDGNVQMLKSIKGIGPKSAQRVILELKDKLAKTVLKGTISSPVHNTLFDEALSALVTLGISKIAAQKAINKVLKENPNITSVEQLVKHTLKNL